MRRGYNRNKKKKLPTKYLLLIMTIICFVTIFSSLLLNISGGPLNTIAGYVFVPMQSGVNTLGKKLSDATNDFKTLNEVLAENEELKKQVDELTTQLTTTKLEQYELDNYRQLLELDEKYPSYEKVAASVIAKDTSNWFSTFTIDKGSNDGLGKGMNVMAGSGLVGILTEVGPNYSTVRTIINDSNNVSGMVTTSNDNIVISGNLQSMNESQTITFTGLKDGDDQVAVGDPVVTSYVSDLYQQGILIGYITTINENSNNLTKSGTITPVVDFEHIEEVLVITQVKVTGDSTSTSSTIESSESAENTEESSQNSKEGE